MSNIRTIDPVTMVPGQNSTRSLSEDLINKLDLLVDFSNKLALEVETKLGPVIMPSIAESGVPEAHTTEELPPLFKALDTCTSSIEEALSRIANTMKRVAL
jgi:hypothetical protein